MYEQLVEQVVINSCKAYTPCLFFFFTHVGGMVHKSETPVLLIDVYRLERKRSYSHQSHICSMFQITYVFLYASYISGWFEGLQTVRYTNRFLNESHCIIGTK
jgi:hypothetical protein